MIRQKRSIRLLAIILLLELIITSDVYGYIDPGTGSYILQMLIAAMLGILFSVKIFWTRIKAFLKAVFGKKNQ